MRKYGKVAIKAVELIKAGENPKNAWVITSQIFIKSKPKPCPTCTFLVLCEEGLIKDVKSVPSGTYTESLKNRSYAKKAIEILKKNPEKIYEENDLWNEVIKGKKITYEQQMDVVLALWRKEYIII